MDGLIDGWIVYWIDGWMDGLVGGPYYVAEDNFSFGRPTKYLRLDPNKVTINPAHDNFHDKTEKFDAAIEQASQEYSGKMHNLCVQNCHHHTAAALNIMEYDGRSNWGQVQLCFLMLLYSSYPSFSAFLKTYLGSIVIYSFIIFAAIYF